MTTLSSVRSALAAALRTCQASGFGLRATPYIVEQISPPQAMFDFSIDPHVTFGSDVATYLFVVTVFCDRSASEASQKFLDDLRDPQNSTGVKQIIEGSSSLHAVVQYARVGAIGAVEVKTVGTVEYLTVDFEIEVVV